MVCITTNTSFAVNRDVSDLQFDTNGWVWIPTMLDDKVESFVGLRTNQTIGENITAVWILKGEDHSWESWGWSDQDQSKAIASVKSMLELPDSTDFKWPVTPSFEQVDEPERLTKGVLESDPFSTTVQVLPDPETFVVSLETVGWKTAWLDIWSFECEDALVLDTWAMAVEATEYEIGANGETSELIQTTFDNTVMKPCGIDPYIRIVESQGQLLIIGVENSQSIFATGSFYDET